MKLTLSDSVWLDNQGVCTAQHIIEVSGLTVVELDALIANGIITPVDGRAGRPAFQLHHLITANTARRLRDDFELDLNGLTLALTLKRHIAQLQTEVQSLQAKLSMILAE